MQQHLFPVDDEEKIRELIDAGCLCVANHSGGKDSMSALIRLLEIVPPSQLLVIHATLGEVEWPGALELAEKQATDAGVNFIVAKANKTFFEMVLGRFLTRPSVPSWPSATTRQCTSDLKRGPIQKAVRAFAKQHGFKVIINCLGIRAEESTGRSKRLPFRKNERDSNSVLTWYEWLPIFRMTTPEVFAYIKAAGQTVHWAYGLGMTRISCVFCIMSNRNDLIIGAQQNPELLKKYIKIEKDTGYTMHMSRVPLEELTKDAFNPPSPIPTASNLRVSCSALN